MDENTKREKKIYLDSRFYYCLIIAVFVLFTLVYALSNRNIIFLDHTSSPFNKNWFYEDGTTAYLEELSEGSTLTVTKEIEKDNLSNRSLCFYTKNVYFTVFVNDNAIYDFHPSSPRLFGPSYGIFPHAVVIPVLYENSTIKIKIDNLYPNSPGCIKGMQLANGNNFIVKELQSSAPEFMLCTIVFALGIVAFVIGIAGRHFGDRRYEIISMGTFAMVSSIWIASESTFFPILLSAPIAIHFVDYMMLAILPLPTVLFAAFVTGNKDSKIGLIIGLISALNLLTQILLTSFKIIDYHKLLIVSHAVLVLTVLSVIVLFVKSLVRKTLSKGLLIILTITFLVPLFIGSFELVRYRLSPLNYHSTRVYQYILFLFVFLCCIYEFISISEMSRKGQYAEIMEKMAYTDGLTGLYNREYYNKFIDTELPEGEHFTFIMLDMNNLKEVNDRLGHLTGDEYIKALAKSIEEAFSGTGDCYRLGGDEFLVISSLLSVDIKFLESLDLLYDKIKEFNDKKKADIPLSVAIGYSDFSVGSRNVKEAMREADAKMYERKKKMKEKQNNEE